MKKTFLLSCALLVAPALTYASPVLISGTPNYLGAGLSPRFGQLINFDDLAAQVSNSSSGYYQLPAGQYLSQGVASITNSSSANPLYAASISQQSPPVYLTTGPGDAYAGDIIVRLTKTVNIIGIGVLSDDVSPVTLNALSASGAILSSSVVYTSASGSTLENGYWGFQDSSADIQSLEIISPANLGIDDLQFAPEPSSFVLLGVGALVLGFGLLRKRTN